MLVNREAALADVYELLEKDFVIQGCSAVEDKLQNDVPQTIQVGSLSRLKLTGMQRANQCLWQILRQAGIKFWMLTGDKYSTALQIATSCNLKSPDDRTLLCSIEVRDDFAT